MTRDPRHDERGMALVVAMLTLLIITVVGIALTTYGMIGVTAATNDREGNEALVIADAGLTHAKAILLSQPWLATQFDGLLQNGNGTACTGDEFSAVPAGAEPTFPPVGELIPATGRPFFTGRYVARLCDNHSAEQVSATPDNNPDHDVDGRMLVRAHGFGRNGAEAEVEAAFASRPLPALVVDGSLDFQGFTVSGAGGGVHANANMTITGNSSCAEQFYSAVGDVTNPNYANGGCPVGMTGGDVLAGSDSIPVPVIDPDEFLPQANYKLLASGVYCGPAGVPAGLPGAGCTLDQWIDPNLVGWKWSNGAKAWSTPIPGGASAVSAVYWSDTNVSIGVSATVTLTVAARGSVTVTAQAGMSPKITSPQAVAVVAGTDLQFGANAAGTFQGLYYARDQIDLGGTPNIVGQVMAKNHGDCFWPSSPQGNPVDHSRVHGSSGTLTYNGNGGYRRWSLIGWRECRGSNPAQPCGVP